MWSAWGLPASPDPKHQWRFGSGGAAERLWSWDGDRAPLNLSEGEAGTWDLRAGFGPEAMGKMVFAPKGKKREYGLCSAMKQFRHDPSQLPSYRNAS